GNHAVQLRRLHGVHVTGTVTSTNLEAARMLKMGEVIEHPATRFEDVVEPVDLVFDTVGGDRLERSLTVVRPGGRLVSVAAEPSHEQAAARGITALYFIVAPNGTQLAGLTKLVDNGEVRPASPEGDPVARA